VRYVHENCRYARKLPIAVPARFVVACKNGHLDDFPWVNFVHGGPPDHPYKLQLLEMGASGEAADIYVRCETCDKSRPMSDAFKHHNNDLPVCRARRPHLRDFDESGCKDDQNQPIRVRALLQGASNAWFPVMLSALSVPQSSNLLKQLVTTAEDLYDLRGSGHRQDTPPEPPSRLLRVSDCRPLGGDPGEARRGDGDGNDVMT
jgi:hypothetical protein